MDPTKSISDQARSAVVWNAAFNVFRDVLQFGTMLILVRLLEPAAYGLFALTTSVVTFLAIFSFQSFVAHSLQVESDEQTLYQQHFTAGLFIQSGMLMIALLLAFAASQTERYAAAAPLIAVLSLTFVLDLPCTLRLKMLERQFDWKRLRTLHAIGLVVSAGLSIVMAFAGAGAYALVVPGMLVTLPFIWDLFVNERWRPDWTWSWAAYREPLEFGLKRIGSGMAVTSRAMLEASVVSGLFGFATMGLLNRANGLAQMFCVKPASQLLLTVYPLLPRLESAGSSLVRAGGLILRTVTWMVIPVAVSLVALAEPVVALVYGPKWGDAVPFVPWTLAMGAITACSVVVSHLILARQRAGLVAVLDIVMLALVIVGLALIPRVGLIGYLQMLVAFSFVVLLIQTGYSLRLKALDWLGLWRATAPPVVGSTVAFLLANKLVPVAPDAVAALFLWLLTFGAIYVTLLRVVFFSAFAEWVGNLPARTTLETVFLIRKRRPAA